MSSASASSRRARRLLALLALALVVLMAAMPKPWSLASGPGFASPHGRSLFDTVMAATFYAAAVDLLLCLGLLASAPLWARPRDGEAVVQEPPPRVGRLFALALLAAAVLTVGLRLPLASGSLWWDEAWSVKRVLGGWPDTDPGREVHYQDLPWSRPMWHYRKPTNHVLYNLSARATLSAWRALGGRDRHAFSELVFRIPALAAAMLTALGSGVLLWRWGRPRAGVAAAFLLAIHPWFIRYGAEGRAYGMAAMLSVALALALTEALRGGRWRAWLATGAALFLLLWNQPASIYLAVTAGACALAAIALRPVPVRERVTLALRFGAVTLLAAMAFLLVMAPNIAQSLVWDDVFQRRSPITEGRMLDLWGLVATGISRRADPPGETWVHFPSVVGMLDAAPWTGVVLYALLPALVLLGAFLLLRDRRSSPWVVAGLVLAVPLLLVVTHVRRMYYYDRFLIHAVVLFAIFAAVGLDALLARLPAPPRVRRLLVPAGLAAGLLAYQAFVLPETRVLLSHPIAPMRDVGEYLRALAGDDPLSVRRVGYGIGGGMVRLYDPWVVPVENRKELRSQIRRARRSGTPLYVFYGYPGHNRGDRPDGFTLIDDPRLFEEVARFHGIEEEFTYRVLRLKAQELQPATEGHG